jgi:hypothetical protein
MIATRKHKTLIPLIENRIHQLIDLSWDLSEKDFQDVLLKIGDYSKFIESIVDGYADNFLATRLQLSGELVGA